MRSRKAMNSYIYVTWHYHYCDVTPCCKPCHTTTPDHAVQWFHNSTIVTRRNDVTLWRHKLLWHHIMVSHVPITSHHDTSMLFHDSMTQQPDFKCHYDITSWRHMSLWYHIMTSRNSLTLGLILLFYHILLDYKRFPSIWQFVENVYLCKTWNTTDWNVIPWCLANLTCHSLWQIVRSELQLPRGRLHVWGIMELPCAEKEMKRF